MKTLTITAAVIAALAVPTMLLAADPSSTTTAWLVCRPAAPSETSNATSNATSGSTALLCRTIDIERIKAAVTKLKAMEDKMDQPTRAQVDGVEKMITEGTTYG
jgi:hypothetical protein